MESLAAVKVIFLCWLKKSLLISAVLFVAEASPFHFWCIHFFAFMDGILMRSKAHIWQVLNLVFYLENYDHTAVCQKKFVSVAFTHKTFISKGISKSFILSSKISHLENVIAWQATHTVRNKLVVQQLLQTFPRQLGYYLISQALAWPVKCMYMYVRVIHSVCKQERLLSAVCKVFIYLVFHVEQRKQRWNVITPSLRGLSF